MISARLRLASLWVSQVARVVADWCLRLTTVLALQQIHGDAAWQLATIVFIAPYILLATLNGCLSNGLPRRTVLLVSSAFALIAVAVFAGLTGSWLLCLGVVALASAVYSPARYAVLPAAAQDSGVPLTRVNGLVEMGGAAAIVAGIWLGIELSARDGSALVLTFGAPVVLAVLGLDLLCVLTALPVHFPSDVIRPEAPRQAAAGFFRDVGRIFRVPAARDSLLGLAGFQALVTAAAWPLMGSVLQSGADGFPILLEVLTFVGIGTACGCVTSGLQRHAHRVVGLVPFGATGLVIVFLWLIGAATPGALPRVPCLLLGFLGGLINASLRTRYLNALPADACGNGMSVMNTIIYLLTTLLALLMAGLIHERVLATPSGQLTFLSVLAAVGCVAAWMRYFRRAFEIVLDVLNAPMYRVHTHGPGVGRVPKTGPLLLIANHASYFDPVWMYKAVPRDLRPMMTSVFFDIPGVSWIVSNIFYVIRVPSATFRREAPELKEAMTILRDGGCVLVFPEAILRRKEEELLRRFGRGVWHVLQELPSTPVMVCWIEGGWGSWASYKDGPPVKNKWPDWFRRIDVVLEEPEVLPPEIRADQWRTREYLMRRCLGCRRYLGLPVPPLESAMKDEE